MPIDHIGLTVPASKFDACVAFYLSALAPLSYEKRFHVSDTVVGLGSTQDYVPGRADFWVIGLPEVQGQVAHVAFSAKDRAAIDAFHTQAISAGGVDNGAPGIRAQYHPNYYAAFVKDPAGNNIEVVSHTA